MNIMAEIKKIIVESDRVGTFNSKAGLVYQTEKMQPIGNAGQMIWARDNGVYIITSGVFIKTPVKLYLNNQEVQMSKEDLKVCFHDMKKKYENDKKKEKVVETKLTPEQMEFLKRKQNG